MTKAPIKLHDLKYILIAHGETTQFTPRFVRWNDRTFERTTKYDTYQEVKVVDVSALEVEHERKLVIRRKAK